jgi:hypothetical protein
MNNGYYDEVKSAISPEDTIYALGHSPWAETSYGGGENLIDVLKAYDLKKYDNMTSAANSDNPYGLNLDSIFNAVDNLTEQDKKTYAVVGAVSLAVFWAVKAFFDRQ